MKKLILIRHAKSSWEYNVKDHERPLNTRGLKDASAVSNVLKGLFYPDLVLISSATRTQETAAIFTSNLKISKKIIQSNHDLYDFSGSDLLKVIKTCNNSIKELMIFGHNHAITAFVNSYGDLTIDNVPTCGVVVLEFEIDNWSDLKPGKTLKTLFPRDLKN